MTGSTPPMDPGRWARVEEVFHAAAELSSAERDAFLDEACADDPELRSAVATLLTNDASDGAVLDESIEGLAGALLTGGGEPEPADLPPGTGIGPYRIVDVLGVGGMGTVYRAERADGAYERQVAIKMVRTSRVRADAERRFEQERQILGRLRHPGIATLVDGGVAEDGDAYLVMELVDGVPITEFASANGLTIEDRVELAKRVAETVDYAHRNLIVHRDLKPSNILVEADGAPKLLDFGIARLLEDGDAPASGATPAAGATVSADAARSADATRTGLFLLTPDYAAPEQIRGESITTATDVYALGAILYELLCGERPFGRVASNWDDLRRVLDEDPTLMTRVRGLDRSQQRALTGDLETIVHKALQKDPARRYDSARAFAADLERYLTGRPIEARPDSVGYRAAKFFRRNRVVSISAAAVVIAGVLGLAGTLWQAREARVQAERGAAVGEFLLSLFEGADPDLRPGEELTALELLEAGVARIDSFAAGPEARIDLLTTLGTLFDKLGRYERSYVLLSQAVDEARASLSADDPALGTALDALGIHLASVGNLEEAESMLSEALDVRRRVGASVLDVASTQGNLAQTIRRRTRYDEAAALYEDAIAQLDREFAGDSSRFTTELMGLAQAYQFQDRFDEADALLRAARRIELDARGEVPFVAHATHNLGVLNAIRARHDEALDLHEEALSIWQRLFPQGHPEIARSYEAIGRTLELQQDWGGADSAFQLAIAGWSSLYGENHTQIATIKVNRANLRYYDGDFDGAAAIYREGIAIWRANDERNLLAAAIRNLGIIERERRDYSSADTLLAEALALRREAQGDVHTTVAEVRSAIAGLRNQQERWAEAEEQAHIATEQFDEAFGPDHPVTLSAKLEWGIAIAAQGRHEEAVPVLEPVLENFTATKNDTDFHLGRVRLWMGVCQAGLGDLDAGRRLIEASLPNFANLPADAPDRLRAERELGRLR